MTGSQTSGEWAEGSHRCKMIAFNACVRQDGHLETIWLLRHLHIGSVQFSDLLNVFLPFSLIMTLVVNQQRKQVMSFLPTWENRVRGCNLLSSDLCCFDRRLVPGGVWNKRRLVPEETIWSEFQHPLILWEGHSPLKRAKKFITTWSMVGPGDGSNFKVLHSVPLVTNFPFFRFSDTWTIDNSFENWQLTNPLTIDNWQFF